MSRNKWKTNMAMTTLAQPPQKFTLTEWHLNNHIRYQCSEIQQELADRLLSKSERVCDQAAEVVKINKEETDYRLKEKVEAIEFLKQELLRIRKEIVLEIDALLTYKIRLSDAFSSVRKNALMICKKCLEIREHRLCIDLVQDETEKELQKECRIIKEIENLLDRTLDQMQEQIRRLKATLYFMDRDLRDKDNNICIDQHNLSLKETNLYLKLCHENSAFNTSTITLKEWEKQTNNNITKASKELKSARIMRCNVDTILKRTTDDLNTQKNATDNAFKYRIEETKEAKTKLEMQHAEIMRQANEMTQNITRIEKSISEKEGYMSLANTRLKNRSQRLGLELTRDPVETNLSKEVYDLRKVVSNLQQTLYEAQTSLRHLLKMQIQLEEDINVKTNTLKIDEVKCMTLRQSIDFHSY